MQNPKIEVISSTVDNGDLEAETNQLITLAALGGIIGGFLCILLLDWIQDD